ncbi:MAG: hypothetical protein J6A63_10505, partial [Clostridia bacterium]|nr:hypothetical protein [Clostridia bacterium]
MKKKHFLGFLASLACLTCFAACGGEENAPDLNKAKDMLDGLYKSAAEVTGSDFERVGKLTIDKNDYTIVWTVELAEGVTEGVTVTKNEDGTYTIDVDEEAEADVAYVLKATITDKNGKTKVVTYNHKVPKFAEMTHEEFVAAEDEAAVVVKGVVTGIVNTDSKHELYFEDADGGYYAYDL